jgi:hypothetical protein
MVQNATKRVLEDVGMRTGLHVLASASSVSR